MTITVTFEVKHRHSPEANELLKATKQFPIHALQHIRAADRTVSAKFNLWSLARFFFGGERYILKAKGNSFRISFELNNLFCKSPTLVCNYYKTTARISRSVSRFN